MNTGLLRQMARVLLALACACLLAPGLARADEAAPANIIVNGGFDHWAYLDEYLDDNTLQSEEVRNVDLAPGEVGPVGWVPLRELAKDQARTATIAMDEITRHAGGAVRIETRDMRDIALVRYSTEAYAGKPDDPHNIRPNRRYRLRWWVKGENIDPTGTGAIMMMFYQSLQDGKWSRTNMSEAYPLSTGTFDWQQHQFVFITDENARWACFNFQLRWTTGTVWYDDVELVDLGPVVHVETY